MAAADRGRPAGGWLHGASAVVHDPAIIPDVRSGPSGDVPSIEVRCSRLLLVLIVVVVSACGGGNEPDSVRTDEPDEPELVACGPSGPSFPRAALDTLPEAPEPDASMAEAMQSFLGSDEGQFWPQDGWRVLSAGPAEALLFVRADAGVKQDYSAYRQTNRDKLKRYLTDYVMKNGGN